MLTDYIQAAMHGARYELLDDGTFFGRLPDCPGVWANAAGLEDCRRELQEVLEDWLVLGLRLGHELPVIAGIDLNAKSVA